MSSISKFCSRLALIALTIVTLHSAAVAGGYRRLDRPRASLTWTELPGTATGIAAAADGSLWGLSTLPAGQADKHVMHLVGSTWTTVSGYGDRISTAPDGAPYVVSSSGGVYSYRNGSWTPVNNSQQLATSAAAGADSGIYFLSRTAGSVAGNFTVWRKPWDATGLIQLPGAGAQIAASFDTSTYTVPGVGTLAPYGYFVLQSSGAITYYSPQGTQSVQFPVSASAIAPVLGGFYALSYPQKASGASVYYFDYASGTTTAESGTYVALSAYGSVGTSPHLFALDAQHRVWSAPISPTAQPVEITEYPVLPSNSPAGSGSVAPGPGGIWFSAQNSTALDEVGLMSAPGHITYYPISPPAAYATFNDGAVEGADGAMWFTTTFGFLRTTGDGTFTTYLVEDSQDRATNPMEVTTAPGGLLWFYQGNLSAIGSMSTTGTVTQYPLTLPTGRSLTLRGIAAGSDGALWFTADQLEEGNYYIGRLTTEGASTFFPLSEAQFGSIATPLDITSGPDGALWFTASGTPAIGRITTSGSISSFPLSEQVEPRSITSGPDGALWFTTVNSLSSTGGLIGRLSTSGSVTYYPVPEYVNEPLDGNYTNVVAGGYIKNGNDGAIYFSEHTKLARITLNQ